MTKSKSHQPPKLPKIPDEHAALLHAAIGMTTGNYQRDLAWWQNDGNHANCHYADAGSSSEGMVRALVEMGLMYPTIEHGSTVIHKVTDQGIKVAKAQRPKAVKSFGKRRYY